MARWKTRKEMTPEERAEDDRGIDRTLDLILERRAYHQAKIQEEDERREREEQRGRELAELPLFRRLIRRLAA